MARFPAIPGYQLQSRLGSGGMGVVYFATRADTDYEYAIKMLLVGRDASIEALARFRVEAEAYACLNHESIIKIRDVGVVSGCPYLAMDYAANGSLDKYLKNNPELDVEWRVQTVRHVADALSHAHGRRILHRDLKPANILISMDGTPKVTDFGLVKFSVPLSVVNASCCTFQVSALDQHLLQMANENMQLLPIDDDCRDYDTIVNTLTRHCANRSGLTTKSFHLDKIQAFVKRSVETRKFSDEISWLVDDMTRDGSVIGSPQYMAPEQALGQAGQLAAHTDVYGLGATLYYMLTNQPPIAGKNAWEVVGSVPIHEPTAPNILNDAVSEDLSLVVMKAIAKKPECRYPNMEMFGEDLDRTLSGSTPLAKLHAHSRSRANPVASMFRAVASSISTILPSGYKTGTNANATEQGDEPKQTRG